MFAVRAPFMADRRFTPAPGPFATLEKYLQLGKELSQELGAASPLFNTALPYFQRALDQGLAHEDIAAVIKLIEADSSNNSLNHLSKKS